MIRTVVFLFVGAIGLSVYAQNPATLRKGGQRTALDEYLGRKDDSYSWKKIDQGKVGDAEYAGLILTSQTWKGLRWKHQLYLIRPKSCPADCKQGLLLIGGGSWRKELEEKPEELPRDARTMARVAEQLKCPIAVVLQVPNQPIFDGKYEDQIIAYTFEKFIRTGDGDWPLLLPMVKSAHRAMDAAVEFARKEWDLDLKSFTVTGASKRGWTTWLTGATDKRVNAIAPMVIDVLNMKPQMEHQKQVWGGYSEQIRDYTERGLQDLLATEKGKSLREIVDPYCYCDRLVQPKLIFIGTNDAYWPIDALKYYWDDLKNDKYVVYVPNNGHGLKDFSRLIGSLHGFQLAAAGNQPMPKMTWEYQAGKGRSVTLCVTCQEKPDRVQLWSATSDRRDFRQSKWTARVMKKSPDGRFKIRIKKPETGSLAFFGEGIFNRDNFPCYLSTGVRVLQANTKQEN